ncbi:MAG: hypothetical protein PHO32_03680 [Candidatus Cloacimonetes bacterium]|nr:hypothetical protein [Candidatus Cloacimonadota bacterium]
MIITLNLPLRYSGQCDGLVYYYSKRLDKLIARRYVVPKESNSNRKLGAISRNLKSLQLSEAYVADLKVYLALYSYQPHEKQFVSWRNVFLTLMFAMAKQFPSVDLLTITRSYIESNNLPCRSVKQAVESGLIPVVAGYEKLANEM